MGSTLQVEGLTTRWHSTKLSARLLALMRNLSGFLKKSLESIMRGHLVQGPPIFFKISHPYK